MNRKKFIIFTVLIIIFTTFTGVWANTEDDLTQELKENMIPIKTTLAESGLEDLMPLKNILKDKKIVAMGEATHGTAEFFQMKHRMFEFLVKEMDYRVFGIEADFGSSKTINDYILHGEGSVKECLDAMGFWTWDTKEVADMINWMKEYNKNLKENDKIRFYGFDMQSMDNSLIYVLDYLRKVGSSSIEGYNSNLKINDNKAIRISKGNADEVAKDIDKINREIIENKDKYILESSLEEYDLILHHIETIYQCLDYKKDDSFNKRDYYMAENVNWILDYESKYHDNKNIMLWAHNRHVANGDNMYRIMGENLKDYHGDYYYSIGFDFYQGSFVAVPSIAPLIPFSLVKGSARFYIDSAPKSSFAHEMMKTNQAISFLDFNGAKESKKIFNFLSKKIHINIIGSGYAGKSYNVNPNNQVILKDTFDAMIFIKSTTGTIGTIQKSELPDGNKILLFMNILKIIMIIFVFTFMIKKTIKVVKSSAFNAGGKYYIFKKENEISEDEKSLKGLIIKLNDYFNSKSTVKYWVFILLIITILNLIILTLIITRLNFPTAKINYLDLFGMIFYGDIIRIINKILLLTLLYVVGIYLIFIFPFTIAKLLLDSKSTNLIKILIGAIAGAIISTFGYRHSGIITYLLSLLLTFITGLIYCYSYDFFSYRNEKPSVNFFIITFFSNLFIILFYYVAIKI